MGKQIQQTTFDNTGGYCTLRLKSQKIDRHPQTKLIMSNFLIWGTHCSGQFRMPSKIVAVATDLCPAVLGTRWFARVLGG